MSRELKYAVDGKVVNLRTFAMDNPGSGGANHEYRITGIDGPYAIPLCEVKFQNGPVNIDADDLGINGIQNEDLLAIVIDRLQGFQGGKFACDENKLALTHLMEAMHTLQSRTKSRMARGVEGTHTV